MKGIDLMDLVSAIFSPLGRWPPPLLCGRSPCLRDLLWLYGVKLHLFLYARSRRSMGIEIEP